MPALPTSLLAKPPLSATQRGLLCWLPFGLLLPGALAAGAFLPRWLWMWTLAVAVFAGFKWVTFAQAVLLSGRKVPMRRTLIYLLLWPGMDAYSFLFVAPPRPAGPPRGAFALLKTAFGAFLLWGVARGLGGGLLSGWTGMVGLIFLLHFGIFDLLSIFWRKHGFDAPPLMQNPIKSASLGEFWGHRWNSGFRDLVFGLWFTRWKNLVGARWATLLLFLFSGLVHDLVISVPAGGGYGLPTAYFLLQGGGLLAEHTRALPLARWRGRWQGRAWTLLLVAGPAFWLFHPPFVRRVILPFMHAVFAL